MTYPDEWNHRTPEQNPPARKFDPYQRPPGNPYIEPLPAQASGDDEEDHLLRILKIINERIDVIITRLDRIESHTRPPFTGHKVQKH